MKYCLDRRQMLLGVIMISAAGLSTALLVITVSSDHLVFCIELYKGNILGIPYLLPDISPTLTPYMSTNIGFWRTCNQFTDENRTSITMGPNIECQRRKWKPTDQDDGNNPTTTPSNIEEAEDRTTVEFITHAIIDHPMMKFVFVFTALGLCIEITGHITCLIDQKLSKKKIFMFITGVLYVFSGLSLLAGVVIFMGVITETSMHQKKVAKDEIPEFRYTYGSSFVLLALSFCLIETSGILAVYLFIIRYKVTYKRQHAKLHDLKSQSELLNEFLSRRRQQSASSEGSRRPSFQPINGASTTGSVEIRIELPPSPKTENHTKYRSPKRELSPAKTLLSAVRKRSFCGNYEEMMESEIEAHNCGTVAVNYCVLDCEAFIPPPPIFNFNCTENINLSLVTQNDTTV